MVRRALLVTLSVTLLAACGAQDIPDTGAGDSGTPRDGGTDAGLGHDGGSDAGIPPAGTPGAPVLSASSTLASVQLTWTAHDALATNYEVLRADDQGNFAQLTKLGASATSYTDSTVTPGPAYAYKVTGSNDAGTGAASNLVHVLAPPDSPSAGGSDTRILLTWGPVQNASSYDVYRVPNSGAPQLLGNVAQTGFVDDGSVQPITSGANYSYLVVSRPASGYVASIGSSHVQTAAVGLDVVANEIFVSDTDEKTVSLIPNLVLEARTIDGGALLDDAGSPIVFESIATSSPRAMVVPGVPRGTYAVTVQGFSDFAVGSARSIDFSQAARGRQTIAAASTGTKLSYSLSALSSWNAADAGVPDLLESLSLGASDFAANLASDIQTAPSNGATTFAGVETVGTNEADPNLIQADAGDAYYLFQLHAQTSGNGFRYLAPSQKFAPAALSMTDATTTNVSGALSGVSSTAISDFNFPRAAYLDPTHASLNPAATSFTQRVFIEEQKGFAAHGWFSEYASADALIVDIPQDGGTGNADLGSVNWANPTSTNWDAFVLVQSTYTVPFSINFTDSSGTIPVVVTASTNFVSYGAQTVPLAGGVFDNSALARTLSAPTSPQLNGASAFAAQSGVSQTSRLSWSAPATGTPGYYLVVVYSITPQQTDTGTYVKDVNGHYLLQFKEVASLTTKDLSATFSADYLPAGASLFATIDAVSNRSATGAIDGTITPYTLGENYASAQTVTALFSSAASPAILRNLRAETNAPMRRNLSSMPDAVAKKALPGRAKFLHGAAARQE